MALPANHPGRQLGPAAVLSEDEIRALLGQLSRRSPSGVRNRALVLVLWRTGLRIAEALALEVRDLRLEGAEPVLRVRVGKGGRPRTVGIHEEAAAALELWLARRRALGLARYPVVFCTLSSNHRGKPLHRQYVADVLRRKAAAAGLEGVRVHPHAFRATLAVELAREGVPLPTIRDVLGHANVAHTDAYLKRVFPAEAVSAVIFRAAGD